MISLSTVLPAVIAAGLGGAIGYIAHQRYGKTSDAHIDDKIKQKLEAAKQKIEELRKQAKQDSSAIRDKTEKELDSRRQQIIELEQRITERERKIDDKLATIEGKEKDITAQKEALENEKEQLSALKQEEETKLADLSGITKEQAQERVLQLAEERTKEDIIRRVRKMEAEGEHELEEKAKDIMATVIQRYAASHVTESVSSYVDVPDESMIGRIIGKEGRNIQHIERLTGCEIIVDETPNSITIAGFSPMRRQVAKRALEQLIKDGRIHPGKIEEAIEEAKKHINEDIRQAGEAAVYELGIVDFPKKLVHLVGRLKYRTSYGQNMLKHSVEAARIATMLAEELGADINLAKKATLLHDIGKAIDHEVEGNHVEVGEKIMRKFGISEDIIMAAAAHHEDYPMDTREAIIVQVADAASAARPGARRESLDEYVKRMEDLEQLAAAHKGVDKAYAIHAGRELRVFVEPKNIDDLGAIKLAQDIAKEIEREMTYPGDVKVNVIRETRADAMAR